MDTLASLITDAPLTQVDLAARLGISPSLVRKWISGDNQTLPKVQLLRQLAAELNVPYQRVLTAALRDLGYVDTAPPQVWVITKLVEAQYPSGETTAIYDTGAAAAAFSDLDRAQQWQQIMNDTTSGLYFELDATAAITVDSQTLPAATKVVTYTWDSRFQRINARPPRWVLDSALTAAGVGAGPQFRRLASTGIVTDGHITCLEGTDGTTVLQADIDRLRAAGLILEVGVDPYAHAIRNGALDRASSPLVEAAQRYHEQWQEGTGLLDAAEDSGGTPATSPAVLQASNVIAPGPETTVGGSNQLLDEP